MPGVFDIDVDYETHYVGEYHGTMGQDDFDAALPDAQAEVDDAVWPYADLAPHEAKVRMAVCAVADLAGNPERRIKSYTAGKVREEYGTAGYSLTAAAAIKRWLGNTGVLKRGRWL